MSMKNNKGTGFNDISAGTWKIVRKQNKLNFESLA